MKIYPWQTGLWQRLFSRRERLPHALLLQGAHGTGKLDFALAAAQALLCASPEEGAYACGHCESCNWFAQGNHPDFRLLEPGRGAPADGEDGQPAQGGRKSQIAVDQIREVGDFLALSSHRAGLRIVLLNPAEALNASSGNALLKMLEEPPEDVLFLLVTNEPQRLLATIRSRCSRVDMPPPSRAQAEAWLETQGAEGVHERLAYVGCSPLRALELDEARMRALREMQQQLAQAGMMDPFAAAARLSGEGIASAVDALHKWIYDLLCMSLTGGAPRYHPDCSKSLQALVKQVDLPKLLDFQRMLTEARRLAQHPLNNELQLENLMIQYTQLFSGGIRQ